MISGAQVTDKTRTVGDLLDYWEDREAALAAAAEPLYKTQVWNIAPEGVEGVVLWGNTTLWPGRVGRERFMTRGHWHLKKQCGELCVTVSGTGLLLLMNESLECHTELLSPGSTHWIDGSLAHRTVNTGDEPLVFLTAWPAACGHDYESIRRQGFSRRIY